MRQHDVLIIGGGIAGLAAALQVAPELDTVLISKVHPLRSHSVAAQGGINAALANHPDGKHDTPELHAFDTVKGSDYLADQDSVEWMCREGISTLYELEHFGVHFSRFPDGTIAQRPFGGGGFPRTCYAADRTGHVILHTLYEQCIQKQVQFCDEWLVCQLVKHNGRCAGVVVLEIATGQIFPIQAKAVILATGGYGRVYRKTTNAYINQGSGLGLAYRVGIALKDMEFVQFHPTSLYGSNILITEGARGEGGYLVNREGKRFMADYAPQAMELAPRDIVARSIWTEIEEGRGFEDEYVHLDLRHLGAEKIMKRLPGIREIALQFGSIDPIESPIPVQPAQHYSMGGIHTNRQCETSIGGIYAAGECGCVSVHGANRLGGNSLLDAAVFGKVAGQQASRYVQDSTVDLATPGVLSDSAGQVRSQAETWTSRASGPRVHELLDRLKSVLTEKVGIFRNGADLAEALSAIRELRSEWVEVYLPGSNRRFCQELVRLLEAEAMLDISEATTLAALNREETRGSHFRTDFPDRQDAQWLKHSMATWTDGTLNMAYSDVTITRHQPQARNY